MVIRLLVFILIFALLWYLLRTVRSLINQQTDKIQQKKQQPKTEEEPMVVCEVCGVYTPQSHAIKAGEKFYCSQEHYQQR